MDNYLYLILYYALHMKMVVMTYIPFRSLLLKHKKKNIKREDK